MSPSGMRQPGELLIGCVAHGVTHSTASVPDLATRFEMVRDVGVFDYVDRLPPDDELEQTLQAVQRTGLPVPAGSGVYTLGRDDALYEHNLRKAREMGSVVHNVQLRQTHADGHALSDEEVASCWLHLLELGHRYGVTPCFEVHVGMWSEHFGRVARVAERVKAADAPWHLTLDASHVIFKIDNPIEQAVQDLRGEIESGDVVLEPGRPFSVMQAWIDAGWVLHAHARAAVPANPVNQWARHPDGSFGRGIQYPFFRPGPGEYVTDDWRESRLEPWKAAMRALLDHHAEHGQGRTLRISTEYIPGIDYGAGHRYSLFEHNVACAYWLRDEWAQALGRQMGM
jgi:hypothetical protein